MEPYSQWMSQRSFPVPQIDVSRPTVSHNQRTYQKFQTHMTILGRRVNREGEDYLSVLDEINETKYIMCPSCGTQKLFRVWSAYRKHRQHAECINATICRQMVEMSERCPPIQYHQNQFNHSRYDLAMENHQQYDTVNRRFPHPQENSSQQHPSKKLPQSSQIPKICRSQSHCNMSGFQSQHIPVMLTPAPPNYHVKKEDQPRYNNVQSYKSKSSIKKFVPPPTSIGGTPNLLLTDEILALNEDARNSEDQCAITELYDTNSPQLNISAFLLPPELRSADNCNDAITEHRKGSHHILWSADSEASTIQQKVIEPDSEDALYHSSVDINDNPCLFLDSPVPLLAICNGNGSQRRCAADYTANDEEKSLVDVKRENKCILTKTILMCKIGYAYSEDFLYDFDMSNNKAVQTLKKWELKSNKLKSVGTNTVMKLKNEATSMELHRVKVKAIQTDVIKDKIKTKSICTGINIQQKSVGIGTVASHRSIGVSAVLSHKVRETQTNKLLKLGNQKNTGIMTMPPKCRDKGTTTDLKSKWNPQSNIKKHKAINTTFSVLNSFIKPYVKINSSSTQGIRISLSEKGMQSIAKPMQTTGSQTKLRITGASSSTTLVKQNVRRGLKRKSPQTPEESKETMQDIYSTLKKRKRHRRVTASPTKMRDLLRSASPIRPTCQTGQLKLEEDVNELLAPVNDHENIIVNRRDESPIIKTENDDSKVLVPSLNKSDSLWWLTCSYRMDLALADTWAIVYFLKEQPERIPDGFTLKRVNLDQFVAIAWKEHECSNIQDRDETANDNESIHDALYTINNKLECFLCLCRLSPRDKAGLFYCFRGCKRYGHRRCIQESAENQLKTAGSNDYLERQYHLDMIVKMCKKDHSYSHIIPIEIEYCPPCILANLLSNTTGTKEERIYKSNYSRLVPGRICWAQIGQPPVLHPGYIYGHIRTSTYNNRTMTIEDNYLFSFFEAQRGDKQYRGFYHGAMKMNQLVTMNDLHRLDTMEKKSNTAVPKELLPSAIKRIKSILNGFDIDIDKLLREINTNSTMKHKNWINLGNFIRLSHSEGHIKGRTDTPSLQCPCVTSMRRVIDIFGMLFVNESYPYWEGKGSLASHSENSKFWIWPIFPNEKVFDCYNWEELVAYLVDELNNDYETT